MKLVLLSLLFFVVVVVTSFTTTNDIDLAKVNQVEGVYVFCQSDPVSPGLFMGSVKSGITMNGKPSELLQSLIKRCRKDHPTANALIVNSDYSRAEAYRLE